MPRGRWVKGDWRGRLEGGGEGGGGRDVASDGKEAAVHEEDVDVEE